MHRLIGFRFVLNVPSLPAVAERRHRPLIDLTRLSALAAVLLALYAWQGQPKLLAEWQWLDILGEGGTAVMAATWALMIGNARPAGRVTHWLVGGLAAMALGAWVDTLDEFFRIPHGDWWDNALESCLGPGGMVMLTVGLLLWRQEQRQLSAQLRKRERLFRDHRAFDGVTHLADSGYLREQLSLEARDCPQQACGLVMLELNADFHDEVRRLGPDEADRLLCMLAQLLLLNLRDDELLCRYAGQRFAAVLPGADAAQVAERAAQLARAVAAFSFQPACGPSPVLQAQVVSGAIAPGAGPDAAQALLQSLNDRLAGG